MQRRAAHMRANRQPTQGDAAVVIWKVTSSASERTPALFPGAWTGAHRTARTPRSRSQSRSPLPTPPAHVLAHRERDYLLGAYAGRGAQRVVYRASLHPAQGKRARALLASGPRRRAAAAAGAAHGLGHRLDCSAYARACVLRWYACSCAQTPDYDTIKRSWFAFFRSLREYVDTGVGRPFPNLYGEEVRAERLRSGPN
jgi:hypothetical protein